MLMLNNTQLVSQMSGLELFERTIPNSIFSLLILTSRAITSSRLTDVFHHAYHVYMYAGSSNYTDIKHFN